MKHRTDSAFSLFAHGVLSHFEGRRWARARVIETVVALVVGTMGAVVLLSCEDGRSADLHCMEACGAAFDACNQDTACGTCSSVFEACDSVCVEDG